MSAAMLRKATPRTLSISQWTSNHGRTHTHYPRAQFTTPSPSSSRIQDQPPAQRTSFPFPTHPNPTPHQIFHLSREASESEIKARYYELVKVHHPDSSHPAGAVSPELRHERFNSISSAYDVLRGKRPEPVSTPRWGRPASSAAYTEAAAPGGRRWSGQRNSWGGFEYKPDVQPDPNGATEPFVLSRNNVMLGMVGLVTAGLLISRMIFISPSSAAAQKHLEARQNLQEARRGAQEGGDIRRQELRKWLEEGGARAATSEMSNGDTKTREH